MRKQKSNKKKDFTQYENFKNKILKSILKIKNKECI